MFVDSNRIYIYIKQGYIPLKWKVAETYGIKLSKEKMVSMFFKNKLKDHIPLNITLYNSPLAQVKKVKFLGGGGVIFDQALTLRSHIDYIYS